LKFSVHLITKVDKKKKNQSFREKTGAQNIVIGTKQYQEKWLQHVQKMDTNRIPKQALQHKPKDEGTQDDRGRNEGTNFILRIKKQELPLILHEHDDDDDDDDDWYIVRNNPVLATLNMLVTGSNISHRSSNYLLHANCMLVSLSIAVLLSVTRHQVSSKVH
jgi:hypothetical protein